jgi:1,4-alpha-glucan branching enzyme
MAKKTKVETIETPPANSPSFNNVEVYSRLTDFDIGLFKAGNHFKLYEKLGSHVVDNQGFTGTYFAVWAPNAERVGVIGNFNGWNRTEHLLFPRWDGSGIWEGWIANIGRGEIYKYAIKSNIGGQELEKADPFANWCEIAPKTASVVWDNWYEWKDDEWMKNRRQKNALNAPYSVYEVHLGSWMKDPNNPDGYLSYSEIAKSLVPYVKEMGFTHVELMPIMEHPYTPSWGYQQTGYFSVASRMGTPQELMFLIEELHKAEIGVLLDWVPSHFPGDAHGLYRFDGSSLYEHEDPRQGYHPDWKSYIFNYGRNEVRSFLISNAIYWLDRYHADGLRVDAVASMLYRDYSRNAGEWIPNIYGGRENLEAISLFKELNDEIYRNFPDVQTIAEESTAFPGVSRPSYLGGLGYGMKWMMGWMNDTIKYFETDPMYRKWHQDQVTFSLVYAFSENFMLPLSHDEVVYGKKSMLNKMPGDEWQKFANLRLLYTYMYTHPGTKLIFMGGEFGQKAEWNFEKSLDWHLTEQASHRGIQETLKSLNKVYKSEAAMFDLQFSPEGFEWIDASDKENCVISYIRKGTRSDDKLLIVLNFNPIPKHNYRIGVPMAGTWTEIHNSDSADFWGSGTGNKNGVKSDSISCHGRENSIEITIPPLAGVIFKCS